MGPRLIPNCLLPTENCVLMNIDTIFSIDLDKKLIEYNDGQLKKQPIGSKIIYTVEC